MDRDFLKTILGKRDKQTLEVIPAALDGQGNTKREALNRESILRARAIRKEREEARATAAATRKTKGVK